MATLKTRKVRQSSDEPLVAEEQVFRRKRVQLLRHHEGRFVALYGERVVGYGTDDEELAQKMFEKLGDVPFYIAKVEKEPTVYELPCQRWYI